MNDKKLDIKDFLKPETVKDVQENSGANDVIRLMTVDQLFNKDNLKSNSRIKFSQVSQLTKLASYGEIFNVPFVNDIVDNILQLQISINGLGRKELVELVSNVQDPLHDPTIKSVRKEIFK